MMDKSQEAWLEANLKMLALYYPDFRLVDPRAVGRPSASAAWEGVLQPFQDTKDLALILDDLENEADVLISGGTLIHDGQCRRTHSTPGYFPQVCHAQARYKVVAAAYPDRRHPRAFIEAPHISRYNFPSHPHINGDGSACSYFPSAGLLPRNEHTIRLLLDFTSIWLAKHIVWVDTGAGGRGIWIGPHVPHTIPELLSMVPKGADCPCGSGKPYSGCCRPGHEEWKKAFDRIWREIHHTEVYGNNGFR